MSTPGGDARLDDSVLHYVGQIVCARPVYGWGWGKGSDDGMNSHPIDVPPSFHFRLTEFFDWNNERRGGIGQIEQSGHIYDGQWMLFYTRLCGCFDFIHKISDYNFHIGVNHPSLYPPSKDPKMAEAWPLPCFPHCEAVWGYGRIGATEQIIEDFEKRRLEQWRKQREG